MLTDLATQVNYKSKALESSMFVAPRFWIKGSLHENW